MKKHIVIFLSAVLFSVAGNSQTFTLQPKTLTGVASCTGITAFQIGLKNIGSSPLSLSYSLISNTLPDTGCWTVGICDCNICHPDNFIPGNDNCYTSIAAGDSVGAFMVYDLKDAKGHIGWGQIKYLIYETSNSSNSDTLTFDITGCSSGNFCATHINENPFDKLEVFPSLVSEKINIDGNESLNHIESVMIYDYQGKLVYSEQNIQLINHRKSINVSMLASGMYTISLYENGFSSTKKFTKYN